MPSFARKVYSSPEGLTKHSEPFALNNVSGSVAAASVLWAALSVVSAQEARERTEKVHSNRQKSRLNVFIAEPLSCYVNVCHLRGGGKLPLLIVSHNVTSVKCASSIDLFSPVPPY